MKIVIVPSGFKECLDAEDVALAMERGVKRFDPSIDMEVIPMIDGGEGFAKAITNIKGGELIYKEVDRTSRRENPKSFWDFCRE